MRNRIGKRKKVIERFEYNGCIKAPWKNTLDAWYLKGEILCPVGDELQYQFLLTYNIKLYAKNLGWSESYNKWFGWRREGNYLWFCGFGIDDTCSKESLHYIPSNEKELISFLLTNQPGYRKSYIKYDKNKITIKTEFIGFPDKPDSIHLIGQTTYTHYRVSENGFYYFDDTEQHFVPWGKGVWTAKTLEDAKQMAIDFSETQYNKIKR